MPWPDRIRDAAYNSPSGVRVSFIYEDVFQEIDKKGTPFEFPDADGTFVQGLGHSGRRYPMRVFFSGNDYDKEAEIFLAALLERGVGKLEHPIYGVVDVVPLGTITQNDRLKTAANQAIFEVTFWQTIGLVFPTSREDPASEVLAAVEEYNGAVSEEFEKSTSLTGATEQAIFKNEYQTLLDVTSSALQAIADVQKDVQTQFAAIVDSINQGIDILIADPLTLAFQTTQLIQSPARALANIEARLDAYGNLITSSISGDGAIALPGDSNEFHTKDLYVSTYITGSVVSVVNNQFITKTEALQAAEVVLDQLDAVIPWRDENFESLEEVDTGGAYQKLQQAVALTAGFLVEISFSLKQERSLILDRNRTVIDLVAEFYGSVDDQLDFAISSNNLSGSEILELPEGREFVYYV